MELSIPLSVALIVAVPAAIVLTFPRFTTGRAAIEAVKQRCSGRQGMLLGFAVMVLLSWVLFGI